MKKIAIVMTYFNRQYQLDRTLLSLSLSKYKNFEVIVVDDSSDTPPKIGKHPYPVTVLRTKNKTWNNPEPAYNIGIDFALKSNPDIIILQNAECYHVGDVISYASGVTEELYITFGCYSIDQQKTFNKLDGDILFTNNKGASHDGENAWYNHPVYRPVAYEFCAAITANNIRLLNGYDERLSFGCGYGDDYLLYRIRLLCLKVEITQKPFVVHQWHYNIAVPPNKADLVATNKMLFDNLKRKMQIKAERLFPFEYEHITTVINKL